MGKGNYTRDHQRTRRAGLHYSEVYANEGWGDWQWVRDQTPPQERRLPHFKTLSLRAKGKTQQTKALLATAHRPASPQVSDRLCHNIDRMIKFCAEMTQVLNNVPVRKLQPELLTAQALSLTRAPPEAEES